MPSITLPTVVIRILSSLVLAPIVLTCVYLGGVWFQGLVALATLIALFEWVKLCRNRADQPQTERLLWLVPGAAYILLACLSLGLLRGDDEIGRNLVFFVLLTVWLADTGAYFAGCLIGGPKLAPRISPKKTWAGLIGALVASVGAGAAMAYLFPDHSLLSLCLTGGIVGGVAQLGDLAESLAKRRFDVKDSGSLIPGHGGILDRIDGLMAASLVMALIFSNMLGGSVLWF